jgi:hypothetical protein
MFLQDENRSEADMTRAQVIEIVMEAAPEMLPVIAAAARGADRPRPGTIRDAALILGTCTRTAERYAKQGCFPRVHLSARKIRYDLTAVEAFARTGRG